MELGGYISQECSLSGTSHTWFLSSMHLIYSGLTQEPGDCFKPGDCVNFGEWEKFSTKGIGEHMRVEIPMLEFGFGKNRPPFHPIHPSHSSSERINRIRLPPVPFALLIWSLFRFRRFLAPGQGCEGSLFYGYFLSIFIPIKMHLKIFDLTELTLPLTSTGFRPCEKLKIFSFLSWKLKLFCF